MEAVEQTYALANVPLVQQMAAEYSFGNDLERFENTLIKTVFPSDKPVTNSQLLMFLGVAKAYKLNPFIREIYAFPSKGGIVPIVSVDGWISLVQRQANYNGHRFVYEWQDGKVGGVLLAVTCFMSRKDLQHPIEHTEFMVECVRGTDVWQKWPRRMMTHRAFIQCARYAFGFSGIYDEDEGERILEGTLTATSSGTFQSEIAMPQKLKQLSDAKNPDGSPAIVDAAGNDVRQTVARATGEVIAGPETGTFIYAEERAELSRDDEAHEDPAPDSVQNLDSLKGLFDSGQIQQGTGNIANVIGKGRAQRLYAILNKHKIHTEKELKLEFLAPRGIEHVPEMPLDIYERVCAWAEGKLEDQG